MRALRWIPDLHVIVLQRAGSRGVDVTALVPIRQEDKNSTIVEWWEWPISLNITYQGIGGVNIVCHVYNIFQVATADGAPSFPHGSARRPVRSLPARHVVMGSLTFPTF